MHPLRLQMLRDLKLRGLALRTQESYIAAVAALAKHYRCSPDGLSVEQVQTYILYLLEEKKLAWSSCNQAICAFRFFYGIPGGHSKLLHPWPGQNAPPLMRGDA